MNSITVRPTMLEETAILSGWIATIPLWQRYGLTAEKVHAQLDGAMSRQDVLLTADFSKEDRACGFAWCLTHGAFGRSMYLRLIGVKPGYAGKGVGGALLAAAEHEALKIGSDMFLLVSDFNQEAQHFYEKHGYQQIGTIPGYVLSDVNELIYSKRLREK